jgi:gamma-glutamylcyclotransferase (GGCT)/AIG2-like uncharacterized protein YtfP
MMAAKQHPTVEDLEGIRVFVYGSLKKGHGNSYLLSGATALGHAVLPLACTMMDFGSFPGLIKGGPSPASLIFGELYKVTYPVLDELDLLEGNGNFYTREKVPVDWYGYSCLSNPVTKNAWVYFLPPDFIKLNERIMDDKTFLTDGVWSPIKEEAEFIKRLRKRWKAGK